MTLRSRGSTTGSASVARGEYFDPLLNVNGRREAVPGYTADVLTDQVLDWLQNRPDAAKPFFLYLSHKSVHYPFQPARHLGRYAQEPIDYPETMANTEGNYQTQSRWIRDRRYSIHGIDHMETGAFDKDPVPDFDDLYHRYCETLHSLDENLGRVLTYLDESGLSRNTLVLYLGDNGFALGEHGFYDKRDAFEVSIRVPLLAYAPGLIPPGTKVNPLVQNIDLAPTILDACGVPDAPPRGSTAARSCRCCKASRCRGEITCCTKYHWEWNFARRRPRWPFARTATSSSSTTASGTGTDSTTCKPTLGNATT